MKTSSKKAFFLACIALLSLNIAQAQEKMNLKIQIEEDNDGKLIQVDTVLSINADQDPQEVIDQLHEELGLNSNMKISKSAAGTEGNVSVNVEDDGTEMTIRISADGNEEEIVIPSGSDPEKIIQKYIKPNKDGKRVIVKKRKDDGGHEHQRVEVVIMEDNTTKGEMKAAKKDLEMSDFKIFPNPSDGIIKLSFSVEKKADVRVLVYNHAGSLLLEKDLGKMKGLVDETLDLGDLSPGVYLVQVWQDDAAKTSKIILK